MVAKAFQVLSDPQKRQIFDQTGSDPDSRGGGIGGGGGGGMGGFPAGFAGARGTPFGGFQGAEISPEDLFNMFFSGGGMGGGGGGIFGDGAGFAFGGPGIRVHQFGGGPRVRRRTPQEPVADEEVQPASFTRMFWQLLPLILFFLLPLLNGLFGGDGGESLRGPKFSLERTPPYTAMRSTPNHNIPFWVNPSDIEGMAMRDVTKLGMRAEAAIINKYNAGCNREELLRQQEIQDAHGFFTTDRQAVKRAKEKVLPNCRKLEQLGLPRKRQF